MTRFIVNGNKITESKLLIRNVNLSWGTHRTFAQADNRVMNVSAFDEEDQPGIPNQQSANDQPLPGDDQEIDLDEVIVDQPDEYYAILNLSRSVTHDQITKRYKQLAGNYTLRTKFYKFH